MKIKKLKIAISSTGRGLVSRVDFRFGRCPYLTIAEIEDKKIKWHKSIPNPNALKGHGAGLATVQLVASKGVRAVITGEPGPNALRVLKQLKIKVYRYKGMENIKTVLQHYMDGKLKYVVKTGPLHKGFGISRVRKRL